MSFYRKLKNYIHRENKYAVSVIFGDLTSPNCVFYYQAENNEWKELKGGVVRTHKYDFLYDYYVSGINPKYKIVNDKIIPYLEIILRKEKENE